MANISVTVQDGNNITLVSTPTPTQVITIDRGIAGPAGPPGEPGNPAGSQYQIQYNSGVNTFTASPNLTFNGSNLIVQGASSSDTVRITQTGAGNALLVEDSANPDATPFAIDATGTVLAGFTIAPAGGYKAYVSGSAFATSAWRVGNNVDGSTSGYFSNTSNSTKSIQIAADPDNLGASSIIALNIDGSEKARFNAAGNFLLGSTSGSAAGIRNTWNPTGGTTAYGMLVNGTVQSDVTSAVNLLGTVASTAATVFNISNLRHFIATSSVFGVGSTVTNQFGFVANADLTEATNNYGFYSAIPAATGAFNFYANGTATNYFAGSVGIGNNAPDYRLDVTATDNVTTTIAMSVQNSSRNYGIGIGAYTMSNRNIGGIATNIDYTFDIGGASIFNTGGVERMRIDASGNLYTANGKIGPNATQQHIMPAVASDTYTLNTTAQTLTNKRINPRVSTTASAASITPDVSAFDQYCLTAQAVALAVNAPTGIPVDGTKLLLRFLDNGTARAITWNATYTAIGVTLPTTTVVSKTVYIGCVYNDNNTRWDVIAVTTQA